MGYYCVNVFKAVQIHHLLYCSKLTMLKLFLFLVVCVCISFVASWRGLMLGPGRWLVLNIVVCENPEQYEMIYNISRKKINRTHDCFDLSIDVDRVVDYTFAVEIDVYQELDGGFKYYQTLSDDCACTFLMKHAEANVKRALTMANIDPPDCPIQPGPIRLKNFVMDYRELPKHGLYGTFEAKVYFLREKVRISCIRVVLNFDERNDDESDEDDDGGITKRLG